MADRDDFDEDEELLLVTGSRSKSAGKKRHRKASDSEDEEDERPARAQKPASNNNKRRAPAAVSDDDEDEYGMDEEERQKLAGMNELEREMYLFEREERLQRQREREQVINQARSKDQEQVEVRASSRRKQAPTGADSAIGKIAAAHAQREERAKKKQQEEEEKQQQRRRERQQQEEEQEAEEDEYEEEEEGEEEEEELASADEGLSDLEAEAEEPPDTRQAKQLGARAEAYDEGTGSYEEAEERATLDDILAITLKRSDLEAWHNEPFFEDLRGCVLRVVNQQAAPVGGQPQYLLCRIADVVTRNSYAFPTTTKNSRTRKWLHLDDLSGHGVFRHQMTMVSNSAITEQEYKKALAKSAAAHTKFITKGDVQQAKERLQHARSFKYDSSLVKRMLEKKRAAGKLGGNAAQIRARLKHELNVARQDGKSEEEVQRIQEELERLEQQQASSRQGLEDIMQQALQEKDADRAAELASQLPSDMALALINQRNKKLNNYKLITTGVAKAAAQEEGGGARDVFARRHTQSKVYWSTKKKDDGDTKDAAALPAAALKRQGSGITAVSLLKGDKKNMDPSELIKVLDLTIDLSRLPQPEGGRAAEAILPKRLLGLRWMQSVEKRQQELAGRSLLSLDDWKRKMDLQQMMK